MPRLKPSTILHRNKMIVVGGLMGASTSDTRESVEANLEFARRSVDWPYIQHHQAYPGTPMTKDFRTEGSSSSTSGSRNTTAPPRSSGPNIFAADEVEFLRWRAEHWVELHHIPAAFAHSPLFLLRNAPKMLRAYLSRQHDPLIPRA